jgi:hypothetical protein
MGVRDFVSKLTGNAGRAINDLHDAERDLRDQLDAVQRQRVEVLQAMPPRAELMTALRELVAGEGRSWRAVLVGSLAESVRGGEPPQLPHELLPFAAFAPDLLIESVRQHLVAGDWADGPSMAARPGLLADLAERERELEAEHARLVDAAAESGITLGHLPGETGRRAQARLAQESARRFNEANRSAIAGGHVEPREVS